MDDKWKGSGYDPEKAWAEVTRPQREERIRKWVKEHEKGHWNSLVIVLGLILSFTLFVGGIAAFIVFALRGE